MRRAIAIALMVAVASLLMLPAVAQAAEPALPHQFYGTVKIRSTTTGTNVNAPVGTLIIAKVDGIEKGRIKVTETGKYGGPTLAEGKLLVSDVAGEGSPIKFYIGKYAADQTVSFHSGNIDELNLTFYCPVLVTDMVSVTIPGGQTNYQVGLPEANTTITVSTIAEVTITITKYYSNPHPEAGLPASMLPRYIDIEVSDLDAIVWPMHVEQTYTHAELGGISESSLGMYYFKAGAWHRCSDTGVNVTTNIVWANMTRDEVAGSPVAVGGTAAPTGGIGIVPTIITLSLTGLIATPPLQVDSEGIVQATCQLKTTDGKLTLDIAKGTKLLDSRGNPLTSLSAAPNPSPPEPPSGANIILAYDLGPDGTTFDPEITLTMKYDPKSVPEGVAEENLVLAYYDEEAEEWVELDSEVDTKNNTIEASVSHFTTFAIFGAAKPAAFTVSALAISPTEVAPDEKVEISVSVANTGGAEGSHTVILKINDVKEAEKSVTVAAGKSQDVSFTVSRKDAGSYSVTIDGLSGSFTVSAVAPPPTPAAFSVSNLSVKPLEVGPKQAVTITVSVANTGGTEGSYTVVLKINGVKEAEKSVTIAAGKSQDVGFSVTREKAGSYMVDVDGLTGSFTVAAKPPINWPVLGGIIAAVVIGGLLIFFLVRRRRAY